MKEFFLILSELAQGIIKPFAVRFRWKFAMFRYRKNSSINKINEDWEAISFNRISFVNDVVAKTGTKNYLEIGCDTNGLFQSVPVINKVGVDPIQGGNVRLESDVFFKTNTTIFDTVFIDGLHTYEQVRRDVVNSIKHTKVGGWVLLHDMIPRNWVEEHVPRIGEGAWTGDVWKVAFELMNTKGIDFKIIWADKGVGIFKILDSGVLLHDNENDLKTKDYQYFFDNYNTLPIIKCNEALNWIQLNENKI
jgi:hypothetical protein